MGDERDILKSMFIIFLMIMCVFFAFRMESYKDKAKQKETYNVEIYHDKDTGITMLIFKDKLGDVLYCEPLEAEVKANEP